VPSGGAFEGKDDGNIEFREHLNETSKGSGGIQGSAGDGEAKLAGYFWYPLEDISGSFLEDTSSPG
jgi:hypothetical protein